MINYKERLKQLDSRLSKLCWKHEDYLKELERIDALLAKYNTEVEYAKEGSILVAKAVEDTYRSLESNITDIVNKALSVVFTENYSVEFKIIQRGKDSKRTQIGIVLKKDGIALDKNLTDCCSGGVLTVISIVFRMAFMLLHTDKRRILLLDEALGSLSRQTENDTESSLEKTVQMLKQLANAFDVQMMIITHTGVE